MQVREFMTSIIITADKDMPLVDAIRLMAAEEIGSLIVTSGDVLEGIVTERDAMSAFLLSNDVFRSLALKDVMIKPVITISPDADIGQTIALMDQTGQKHIPVVEGNDVIGIVTSTDVIRVLATLKLVVDAVPVDED